MKAAQFNQYGGTEVIIINETADKPTLKEGQVLVEVFAASINPVESAIRNGHLQQMLPLSLPANLGGDFSGVVSAVSEGVTEFKVGDEVYGVGNQFKGGSGGVAEYVAANVSNTGLRPHSTDHPHSAALPLVGTSAVQAIEEHINLTAGQKILIHGGAGGVGSIAVQLAKNIGAYVVATVSNDDMEFAKSLGADEVIDYKNQNFTENIKDFDAVFDTVGGDIADKSISVLKKGGILVSMAGQPNQEIAKEQEVIAISQMTSASSEQLKRLAQLVDEAKVKPQVDKIFPLSQTKAAFDYLEKNSPRGKVVITVKA